MPYTLQVAVSRLGPRIGSWACFASIVWLFAASAKSAENAFEVTPSENEALEGGRAFARVVTSPDPTEVVTIAGVRLRASAEAFAQCAMIPGCLRQRDESNSGRLAATPMGGDFVLLRLDARDLDELRRCRVGRCDLRLPREVIESFVREVDWQSPNAVTAAATLFRTFLSDRAKSYRAGGHAVLSPYADRTDGSDVASGMGLLLGRSNPGLDGASDLRRYLSGPPVGLVSLVDEYLVWHRERLFRKSVISLEHVVVARRDDALAERVLVVSKKIYSSHYFEAALEVVEYEKRRAEAEGRLEIVARSRTDIRRSGFSWLERLLMRRSVKGRIESQLANLRERLDHAGDRAGR